MVDTFSKNATCSPIFRSILLVSPLFAAPSGLDRPLWSFKGVAQPVSLVEGIHGGNLGTTIYWWGHVVVPQVDQLAMPWFVGEKTDMSALAKTEGPLHECQERREPRELRPPNGF